MRTCEYCEKAAKSGDLCWAHIKRRQRGRPMSGEPRIYRVPMAKLIRNASTRRENAEGDDEYRRADRMLIEYSTWQTYRKKVRVPKCPQAARD